MPDAKVTISRTSYTGEDDYVTIDIVSGDGAKNGALRLTMTLCDYALAITGLARQPAEITHIKPFHALLDKEAPRG